MKIPLHLLSLIACSIAFTVSETSAVEFTRDPYLQQATSSGITVVFRTDHALEPRMKCGEKADRLDLLPGYSIVHRTKTEASAGAQPLFSGEKVKSAPAGTHQYEITVTGLEADSTYYYALFDGEKRLTPESETYRFTTHPEIGKEKDALIWIVGDSGTGNQNQRSVYQAMLKHLDKTNDDLDLYLHVGDMAYGKGTDPEFSNNFFKIYEPTLRHVVCWPTLGNHEGMTSQGRNGVGPYFDGYVVPTRGESGGEASGTEAYYSFDYGKIHFICLDSHDLDRSANGAMAKWLKADLEKTKAEWLIAFWHHPPYTKGSHDSDTEMQLIEMREQILPILESNGVDCVFTGHSHIYERSMLIDQAYATPTVSANAVLDDGDGDPAGDGAYKKSEGLNPNNGAVYVVAGNGGKLGGRKGTSPIMRTSLLELGSCLMSIEGDTLKCIMVNNAGEVRDVFSIEKDGEVTPIRIAKPWTPTPLTPDNPVVIGGGETGLPDEYESLIPKHANWFYKAGGDVPNNWTNRNFDFTQWSVGKAGFGYGDNDDSTVLDEMLGKFTSVFVAQNFDLIHTKGVALAIRFDDAFIAYVNGKEALRVGVSNPAAGKKTKVGSNEATKKFQAYVIPEKFLKQGRNVISIEGLNRGADSSDFTLDPFVIQVDH